MREEDFYSVLVESNLHGYLYEHQYSKQHIEEEKAAAAAAKAARRPAKETTPDEPSRPGDSWRELYADGNRNGDAMLQQISQRPVYPERRS